MDGSGLSIPCIDFTYDHTRSEEGAKKLACWIQPKWREYENQLTVVKFTDGITNTLLKISRKPPGATQSEVDRDTVLMRAYGNNTDLIIDREREVKSHALLAQRGMAPPLLARFNNGLLYRFVPGQVTTSEDLTKENIWRGVAIKLGEWHARGPVRAILSDGGARSSGDPNGHTNGHVNGHANGYPNGAYVTNGTQGHTNGGQSSNGVKNSRSASPLHENRMPKPNLWSVLQKFIEALPTSTDKGRARRELLQREIERSYTELDRKDGIGEQGLIFGHCDLLSGNVIVLASPNATPETPAPVTFIDYEYATPCPAAYDLANHFAEWAGFELEYSRIPTKSVRRAFIREYVASYNHFATTKVDEVATSEFLFDEVDRYRGMPGLYWGIWALIQARISEIDFDYAHYAEQRLNEYWAWRAAKDGSRAPEDKATALREEKWNED